MDDEFFLFVKRVRIHFAFLHYYFFFFTTIKKSIEHFRKRFHLNAVCRETLFQTIALRSERVCG